MYENNLIYQRSLLAGKKKKLRKKAVKTEDWWVRKGEWVGHLF